MKAMGAPLGSTRSKKQKCSDEEMLVSAVALARNNSTLTRTLPVVLSKNVKRLDFEKLAACARKRNARQELGFFLDLTGVLAHDSDLRTKADSLFDRRRKRVTDFFKGKSGKYSARLADQNTPPVAQKWLYRMNMNMDSFQSLFVKHVRTS